MSTKLLHDLAEVEAKYGISLRSPYYELKFVPPEPYPPAPSLRPPFAYGLSDDPESRSLKAVEGE